ncbi:hypothetical protein VRU48_16145 [Pedobacter sp. KR3-3]|uniref:Uncharacterized protein n=1 Tax=Pedobacter albus TaxID=3113905 RepID=A0ABU7IB16_9SPHI|nr:hypothetical protein [Pedobacter sp. KR3-3]MEE1946658.1 hypothetical protein [Pedobacter sp. KR3-3]
MKKISLICLTVISLYGCQPKNDLAMEIQVIHQTFEQAVVRVSENDFHSMMRLEPKFPLPGAKPLTMQDTTLRVGKHIYQVADSLFSAKHFKYMPQKGDPVLVKQLIEPTLQSEFVELVQNAKDYQLVKATDSAVFQNKNFNGRLSFSRVAFNADRTEACYYVEQYKNIGRWGWGMGTLVFVAKKNGKWVFARAEEIWII